MKLNNLTVLTPTRSPILKVKLYLSRLLKTKFVRSRYGVQMLANWTDQTFRHCIRGSYGDEYANYLRGIETQFAFVDIGSNQGIFSLIAAKNRNLKSIIAFEPLKTNSSILEANLSQSGFKTYQIHQVAIDSSESLATIYYNDQHSGATSLCNRAGTETEVVKTISFKSLNNIFEAIPTDAPIVVKIDVEGHEQCVIDQLVKLSRIDTIASIFFEFHILDLESEATLLGILSQLELIGFDHTVYLTRNDHRDCLVVNRKYINKFKFES